MNNEQKDQFDDNEWSSLIEDWQSQPVKDVDAKQLLRKIKRRSWVIWVMSMFDVIAVAGCGVGSLLIWFNPEKSNDIAVLMMAMFVWGVVILYFEWKLRKGTWRLKDQGNESILAFSIRRCEVAIGIGRFFTPALISAALMTAVWQVVVYWMSDKFYGTFMVVIAVWFLIVVAASKWFIARKEKELARLKAML